MSSVSISSDGEDNHSKSLSQHKSWLPIFIAAFIALLAGAGNSLTTKVLLSLPCNAVCYPNTTFVGSIITSFPTTSNTFSHQNNYGGTSISDSTMQYYTLQDDDSTGSNTNNDDDGPTNYPNGTRPFAKPLYSVLIAFIAMSLSIFWVMGKRIQKYCSKTNKPNSSSFSNNENSSFSSSSLSSNESSPDKYTPSKSQSKLFKNKSNYNSGNTQSGLSNLLLSIQDDNTNSSLLTNNSVNTNTPVASSSSSSSSCSKYCYYAPLLIPTILDLIATLLQAASVLFISAGVSTALRGTLLLFTGLASWCVGSKEKQANGFEWLGIFVSSMGAIIVGLSAFLNDNGIPRAAAIAIGFNNYSNELLITIGIVLSTLSNVVQGIQVAYETLFLEGNKYTAMETNGIEGIYGIIFSIGLLALFQYLPYNSIPLDNGYAENSKETLCCLENSPSIVYGSIALGILFAISTIAYMNLSSLRGGNFRALLMVARGGIVWASEIIYYYIIENPYSKNHENFSNYGGRWGEPWGTYSWVAAVGFVIMAIGGIISWKAQSLREEHNLYQDIDEYTDDTSDQPPTTFDSTTTTSLFSSNNKQQQQSVSKTSKSSSIRRNLPYGQKGIYADLLAGLVEEEEINYL